MPNPGEEEAGKRIEQQQAELGAVTEVTAADTSSNGLAAAESVPAAGTNVGVLKRCARSVDAWPPHLASYEWGRGGSSGQLTSALAEAQRIADSLKPAASEKSSCGCTTCPRDVPGFTPSWWHHHAHSLGVLQGEEKEQYEQWLEGPRPARQTAVNAVAGRSPGWYHEWLPGAKGMPSADKCACEPEGWQPLPCPDSSCAACDCDLSQIDAEQEYRVRESVEVLPEDLPMVRVRLGNMIVWALVDSGAGQNFISSRLVGRAGWQNLLRPISGAGLQITVANGARQQASLALPRMRMHMGPHEQVVTLYHRFIRPMRDYTLKMCHVCDTVKLIPEA